MTGEVEAWTRHTGARGQWFEGELVPAFIAEHSAVRVKHVAIAGTEEYYEKFVAAVAAGVPPGLTQLKDFWVPDLAVRQVLAPLDGYVPRSKVVRPEHYLKIQWDASKWAGKLYAVPMYAGATNLFANLAAAREAGLVDASGAYRPADTWEEFATQAALLTSAERPRWGTQLYRYDANESTLWAWLPYLYQNGGEFVTRDYKKPLFQRPEGIEALQYQVNLLRTGLCRPSSAPVSNPVENGHVGIWVTGSGGAEGYKRAQGLEFDVAPLPKKQNRASSVVGNNYALSRGAPNAAAAWALLEFLERDEHDATFNRATGNLPAKVANLAQPPWSTERYQQIQIQMARLPETRFRVMFPGTPTWACAWGRPWRMPMPSSSHHKRPSRTRRAMSSACWPAGASAGGGEARAAHHQRCRRLAGRRRAADRPRGRGDRRGPHRGRRVRGRPGAFAGPGRGALARRLAGPGAGGPRP